MQVATQTYVSGPPPKDNGFREGSSIGTLLGFSGLAASEPLSVPLSKDWCMFTDSLEATLSRVSLENNLGLQMFKLPKMAGKGPSTICRTPPK